MKADEETLATEGDALLKKEGGTKAIAPLSTRLMDVVRVYWHLGFIAFGGPTGS